MTIHAYSPLYLSRAARAVGTMLHTAVLLHHVDGEDFLNRFIQSDIAEQFENGNPRYIAGKSGTELFIEVMEKTTGEAYDVEAAAMYERGKVYWVGWMLTQYQWHSGRSFRSILDTVSFEEMSGLYNPLHEADIHKSYEALDAHFMNEEIRLKNIRKRCGLTQEALAKSSGVSLNTIRAYECGNKELKKAGYDIIIRLTKTLKCEVTDLFE